MKNKVLKALKEKVNAQFDELGVCEIIKGEIICDDKDLLLQQIKDKMKLILIKK